MNSMDDLLDQIAELALAGLHADKIKNKQWFLEEIAKLTVFNFQKVKDSKIWKTGISP